VVKIEKKSNFCLLKVAIVGGTLTFAFPQAKLGGRVPRPRYNRRPSVLPTHDTWAQRVDRYLPQRRLLQYVRQEISEQNVGPNAKSLNLVVGPVSCDFNLNVAENYPDMCFKLSVTVVAGI